MVTVMIIVEILKVVYPTLGSVVPVKLTVGLLAVAPATSSKGSLTCSVQWSLRLRMMGTPEGK